MQPAVDEEELTGPQNWKTELTEGRGYSTAPLRESCVFPELGRQPGSLVSHSQVAVKSETAVARCLLPGQIQGGRQKARVPGAKPGESTRDFHGHLDKSVKYS